MLLQPFRYFIFYLHFIPGEYFQTKSKVNPKIRRGGGSGEKKPSSHNMEVTFIFIGLGS